MTRRTLAAAVLAAATMMAADAQAQAVGASTAGSVDLPEAFDYMGPTVRTLDVAEREVAYVDTGPEGGTPVLFIGGTGTSAAAVGLTDFLRTMREGLGLRLISVGRAGFGQSAPAEGWRFEDYATDALAAMSR